jgi:hypothetical protein
VLNHDSQVEGNFNGLIVEHGWTEAELANRIDYGSAEAHAGRLDDLNIACLAVFADVELQYNFSIVWDGCGGWELYASGIDDFGRHDTGAYWASRG